MMLGSDGATCTEPTDDASFTESKIGYHVVPALVVFQTPPSGSPMKNVPGLPITPLTAETRPPRNGPIMRHCRPEMRFGSIGAAAPRANNPASRAEPVSQRAGRIEVRIIEDLT